MISVKQVLIIVGAVLLALIIWFWVLGAHHANGTTLPRTYSYSFSGHDEGEYGYTSSASAVRQGSLVYYPVPSLTAVTELRFVLASRLTFVSGSVVGRAAGTLYLVR